MSCMNDKKKFFLACLPGSFVYKLRENRNSNSETVRAQTFTDFTFPAIANPGLAVTYQNHD